MKALGTFVDWLTEKGAGRVSESHLPAVTVDALSRHETGTLRRLLEEAGLATTVVDAVGDTFADGDLESGEAPFAVTFSKPQVDDELFFVSTRAFGLWLMAPTSASIVRVARCEIAFRTEAFQVGSPDTVAAPEATRTRKSPRRVVRDTTGGHVVPADVCPYLLDERSHAPRGDRAFEEWLARSASRVALTLPNEVHSGPRLEFSGPPRYAVEWLDPDATPAVVDWFEPLQEAVRWVYDIDREVELRHRLYTQEFARLAYGKDSLPEAILKSTLSALEGARIAYAFHLQEISKDALKGLADLRKAVADDTQKVFEATRQLGLSAAGVLFYAVGLLAARAATALPPLLFGGLLLLGMGYVGMIIVVNERAIGHQRELRNVWRSKLYRYLTEAEFTQLVQEPTTRAEKLLITTMWMVLVLAGLVFTAAAISHQ